MSEDAELQAIRSQRLAQMKAQSGQSGGNEDSKHQESKQREMEERRHMMLARVLSTEARERISRIALVKPERAREVEDLIIQAAQSGQIQERVDEDKLKQLLSKLSENEQKTKTKVTIQRRKGALEDD